MDEPFISTRASDQDSSAVHAYPERRESVRPDLEIAPIDPREELRQEMRQLLIRGRSSSRFATEYHLGYDSELQSFSYDRAALNRTIGALIAVTHLNESLWSVVDILYEGRAIIGAEAQTVGENSLRVLSGLEVQRAHAAGEVEENVIFDEALKELLNESRLCVGFCLIVSRRE